MQFKSFYLLKTSNNDFGFKKNCTMKNKFWFFGDPTFNSTWRNYSLNNVLLVKLIRGWVKRMITISWYLLLHYFRGLPNTLLIFKGYRQLIKEEESMKIRSSSVWISWTFLLYQMAVTAGSSISRYGGKILFLSLVFLAQSQ